MIANAAPAPETRARNQYRFRLTMFHTMKAPQTNPRRLCDTALLALFPAMASLAFAAPAKDAYFGENTTPSVVALLPMPPDVGSPEDAADRASSLAVYSARTPEQVSLGKSQDKLTVFLFSGCIGDWFQKTKCPKTDALFQKIDRELAPLIESAKRYYERPHPVQVDSERFRDVIAKNTSGSYPGGHATRAAFYSIVLAELFPERRAEIATHGREIGWLRVTGGVDTPLDVYAGRVFGRALAQALMRNPGFLVDFEEVRDEVAAFAPASR